LTTSKVGIIANPASGKDIRRLVAFASVCDNMEKVNIVRRSILGMASVGVEEILIMPDTFGIGGRVIESLRETSDISGSLDSKICSLDMPITGTDLDSTNAARIMDEAQVGCIIVVGGDGTNRAVAKSCGETPILPVSTGTNNVVPYMIESTVAGLAAGILAKNIEHVEKSVIRSKKLHVKKNGYPIDIALVDAVVTDDLFIGARALWDMSKVRLVVATRGEPTNIGMSSISGMFFPISVNDPFGVSLKLGGGGFRVKAPVAPGIIEDLAIEEFRKLRIGEEVVIESKPSMLALDGEREVEVYKEDNVEILLEGDGPLFVNVEGVLREAVRQGFFQN
jgi:predicted polyphosphate/ATP-dependent NAD kinase